MLCRGDKVAFVSPSGWIEKSSLINALNWFEKQGLDVVFGRHAFDVDGYEAGNAKDRASDINEAFLNDNIKAVFCTRGGAGSLKVLKYLDYEMIKKHKKPIFGLSDSTALQNALYAKTGLVSYTGFLPAYDFKNPVPDYILEQSLLQVFASKSLTYGLFKTLNEGVAEGILIGGCLSVFASLFGTEYMPDFKDKILVLEDVGEKTYRLDLMLEALKLQKGFDKVRGIIFGAFTNCNEADDGDGTVDEILSKFASSVHIPVIKDFEYGHIKTRFLMPIGGSVRLETKTTTIETFGAYNQD